MKKTQKIAITALLACLSTLAFTIESLFPPMIIPGAKMGISNIFILIALLSIGKLSAFSVLTVKVTLGSLFSGNISAMIYSFPAGLLALIVEIALLYLVKKVSVISVSVSGAVVNITIQNIVFCLVTNTVEYLFYLPYLALIGIISGILVGISTYLIYVLALAKIKIFNKGD